jgi:NADPH-dependent 2,4-dienoyl-CoA reductase/sulfur reductase-like enzyme
MTWNPSESPVLPTTIAKKGQADGACHGEATRRQQQRMSKPVSICVIGSGYVGLVAAACFAEIGHRVICVDNDEAKVKQLRDGGVPIFEDHLPDLLAKHRGSAVTFTAGRQRRRRPVVR